MTELLTAAQMRAIEQAAIDSGEVTGLELMERAGRGVVEAIFEEWPELAKTSHKAVVLCGPGNNGGDGFVVARLLHDRGWAVEVFLYGDPERLPPDARVNFERWLERGEVRQLNSGVLFKSGSGSDLDFADIWVDALFGTGLARALSGPELTHAIMCLNEVSGLGLGKVIACDLPSGLCSDSGRELVHPDAIPSVCMVINSDLVVTFHRRKLGHLFSHGLDCIVKLRLANIGLDDVCTSVNIVTDGSAKLIDRNSLGALGKSKSNHKFSHGHALILSGHSTQTGAARLAARGALRIGAGLVTVGSPADVLAENAAQLNAIMLKQVDGAEGLSAALADARINALCLGPGMGVERARELVPLALEASRATVLDADALSAFADAPEALFAMLHENCVLTPHAGEFARLFPDIAEKLNAIPTKGPAYSKVDAAREAAARAGCVVLFKGPDTVIAAPDGRCSINSAHHERSAPWLATAGSGDVLAGFVTGLMARGFSPMEAAETGAWLHVECALSFGPGLIAEDLPEELPKVFKNLGV